MMPQKKFKDMTIKEKIGYLLRYKLCDLFLGGTLLVMAGTLVWQDYIAEKPLLHVEMIDAVPQSSSQKAFEPFLESLGYEYAPEKLDLDTHIRFGTPEEPAVCNPYQLLFCAVNAGQEDIYFWDDLSIRMVLSDTELMDLREILPPELLEKNADRLIYTGSLLHGGFPCGIYLEENFWLDANPYYKSCAVGISSTARNPENAAAFLAYLLK